MVGQFLIAILCATTFNEASTASVQTAIKECSKIQKDLGCCEPVFTRNSGEDLKWKLSENGAGGDWTSGPSYIQFNIANDKQCEGTADQRQTGTAIMDFDTNTAKTIVISMTGRAEADHETFELFVDDKLMVKVQASDSSSCEANTCRMCKVSKDEQEFTLNPGSHSIRIEIDTKDEYYHNNSYFRIDFAAKQSDVCKSCKCQNPADDNELEFGRPDAESHIRGPCSRGITVYSSNKGTKKWESRLGDYDLVGYDASGSAIYEHAINKGKFLYKINGFDDIWMAGDAIGRAFGWFGHTDCKSKCPNECNSKKWQYWKGEANGGNGLWDFDHTLKVEERMPNYPSIPEHSVPKVAEECEDTLDKYSADLKNVNCTHIVNSNYCGNKYYGKYCCKSCAIAAVFKKNMKKAKGSNMDNQKIHHISHDPNQLLWTDPEYLQSDPDADYIFTSPDDERMSDSLPNNKESAVETIDECIDDPKTDCQLVVRGNQCGNHNYAKRCCKSCKTVNQRKNTKGLSIAEKTCKEFGKEWNITRTTQGSAVCSKVSYLLNCHNCTTWRLLVWIDGACDGLKPSDCRSNTTKAGHYYCGYSPCKTGDLIHGGIWDAQLAK